jgi:hypothetical protein
MKTHATCLILAAAFLVPAKAATQSSTNVPVPPASDMVEIDGAKNPEMIPQWSAWGFAFRVIAGGPNMLPPALQQGLSKEEAAIVVGEALENQKRDAACQERLREIEPSLPGGKAAAIDRRQAEMQIECRWQTLHARDRLLERLSPEGRAVLIAYVESTKAGTTVTISSRELAHYRQPQ